jgi:nucleotide-binding universal stress UspA family protein
MTLKLNTILVPVDGSDPSYRALDFAVGLAGVTGAILEIVSVVDIGQVDVYDGFYLNEDQVDEWQSHIKEAVLEKAVARVPEGGPAYRTRLLRGNVVKLLLKEIEREDIELIVLGRTGRTGLERLLQGSVAERIAKRSVDPVILVP